MDLTSAKVGDEVTFKLDVQVPNTKDMTSLVIQDDLEDVLEANKEVKVTLQMGQILRIKEKLVLMKNTKSFLGCQ